MEWDPNFLAHSPMFEALRISVPERFGGRWPDLAELQALLEQRDAPVQVSGGELLRVVPQLPGVKRPDLSYEERIFLNGELPIRPDNWHDLFNFLVWLSFPRAKAALNARHYMAIRARAATGAANRGPVEDALTLFDEGGVIVGSTSRQLIELLGAFEWKELFWRRRQEVMESMQFRLFGHALCEKALRPFAGITGRGIGFDIDDEFLRMRPAAQLAELDERLAEHIDAPDRLTSTRNLLVVPVLGVPGWCAENEVESYYDDTEYFRPRPIRRER